MGNLDNSRALAGELVSCGLKVAIGILLADVAVALTERLADASFAAVPIVPCLTFSVRCTFLARCGEFSLHQSLPHRASAMRTHTRRTRTVKRRFVLLASPVVISQSVNWMVPGTLGAVPISIAAI